MDNLTWKCIDAKGPLPTGRLKFSFFNINNDLYVFGGYNHHHNNNDSFNDCHKYSLETKKWSE